MTTKTKECPRCGGTIEPPRVSLSRWDNKTEVCSRCGGEEAMAQFFVADDGGSREEIHEALNPRTWWNNS